jgi:phytoene desaturase
MKENRNKKALVIGSGVAGLAVSIRLACQGFSVTVFESNSFPGGKLSEIRLGAYRFDAGPSLFTMPHLVEELFWLAGKPSKDFRYKKLEEVCRYFYPDKTRFTVPADGAKRIDVLANALGENPKTLESYLDRSKLKYNTIGSLFVERSLREVSTFFNRKAFQAYLNLPKLGLFESLASYNETVFRNPKTRQLFNRYATYNGSDPYQTPAVMSMIPHLEFGIGAFFPEDGMHQITQSLYELAREKGVEFRFDSPVSSIEIKDKKATGIYSEGSFIPAEVVISAIDVNQTYARLLPVRRKPFKVLPKSTSAIIWYWGISRKTPETGLHNIFFSTDYKKEFEALFKTKTMPSDPTIYLNISSKERPADAPEHGENWFVMVNAPANEGQNWDQLIAEIRIKVMARLKQELGFDPEMYLKEETVLDPRSLESRTGALGGSLYGSNSNDRFAAFLRHTNHSSDYSNLYFCGGTVHPGGGIPLALQSAAMVSELVGRGLK